MRTATRPSATTTTSEEGALDGVDKSTRAALGYSQWTPTLSFLDVLQQVMPPNRSRSLQHVGAAGTLDEMDGLLVPGPETMTTRASLRLQDHRIRRSSLAEDNS